MYIDIVNLIVILSIFISGAFVFFLGFYVASKYSKNADTNYNDNIVEFTTIKNPKSSIKVKTKKEEQEQEAEHTTFYN